VFEGGAETFLMLDVFEAAASRKAATPTFDVEILSVATANPPCVCASTIQALR
jgi:hypothetical protein